MKQILLIGFLVLGWITASAQAAEEAFAVLVGGQGSVSFAGHPLKVGDVLSSEGLLKTGPNSSAFVYFKKKSTTLTLAASTELQIVRPDPTSQKQYVIETGSCRWNITAGKPVKWVNVRTHSAVLGVRGTDFLATFNPLLDESEVVVFSGKVQFTSAADPFDTKEIPMGYWGGVGGRFGKKIGELIHLPPNVLETLKKPVEVKARVQEKD